MRNLDMLELMPPGWNKKFGKELRKELEAILEQYPNENFELLDVKEKFGRLTIHFLCTDLELYFKVESLISGFADLSEVSCMVCGEQAVERKSIYDLVLCEKHS